MLSRPGWIEVPLAGFLPGLLAGTQVAGLLFFLNPGLPFAVSPVVRAVLVYGCLVGLVSLAIALPWIWGRPWRARRMLPWGLAAALTLAAVVDAGQASRYSFFLPTGINDRLVKAALWLSVAALVCFYTALLHSLNRRRYGARSRIGLGMVAVLSVFVMIERREAFRVRPQPGRKPLAVEAGTRPSLWVIGLDAATLDAILPLAGEGKLPFLAGLLRQGAYGRLQSLTPHRPQALWATLATGKYPYKHGVLGGGSYAAGFLAPGARLELLPAGFGFERWGTLGLSRSSEGGPRSASALWEVLQRLGLRCGMLGWPGSSPAPLGAAFALTDRYFEGARDDRAAQPPGLAARLAGLRPPALEPARQARFGRRAGGAVLAALRRDLWQRAIARELVGADRDLDAFFWVLPGLASVSVENFGGYSAAAFEGSRAGELTDAKELVSAYYLELDEMLKEMWEGNPRRGPKILAIVSAYGVEGQAGTWGRLRAGWSRTSLRRGRTADSPDGVLLLAGEGFEPGRLLTGARLVDVVPTLLYALGFPVARDLDGKVLTPAFDKGFLARHPLTFLPSYETLTAAARR